MIIPPPPTPTLKERVLKILWQASGSRPSVDLFFTSLLKRQRAHLISVDAGPCIPRFDESEVKLTRCPVGTWSTPLIDVYVLIKAAIGFEAKRILELGSYRGDTARLLAENTPETTRICTVDMHPDHGSSYRGTPVEPRIDRKVGRITQELFSPGEKYDLIFVDADHDYQSVMNDTAVAFSVLSEQGVIFWHDYHFEGYFHGMAGIPEALKHFSSDHAIIALGGTRLAMCSRHPGWETTRVIAESANQRSAKPGDPGDVWQETQVRG